MELTIDGVKYYPAADLVRRIGVSRQTLWRWRKQEKVPSGYHYRDGRLYFTEDECRAVMEYANHIEPASVPQGGNGASQLSLFG